jgi:hypothetical protein
VSSRLSLAVHPRLGDHPVWGMALVPGTVLLDMAVTAGDQAGHGRVEELALLTRWYCRRKANASG